MDTDERPICPRCKKFPCEKIADGYRKQCWTCRIKSNPKSKSRHKRADKIRRDAIKKIVLGHYGGKCSCCGEANQLFLTVDHINNDGAKHRRSVSGGSTFHYWIKKNNFPKNLQVLCFNCNCGKNVNGGVCPHKTHGRVA